LTWTTKLPRLVSNVTRNESGAGVAAAGGALPLGFALGLAFAAALGAALSFAFALPDFSPQASERTESAAPTRIETFDPTRLMLFELI
jgi:hypothetical protein